MDGAFFPPDRDGERGRTEDGDLDPALIAHELEMFGREYAEANANAKLLEKQEAVVMAQLVQDFRCNPDGRKVTRADAQDMARCSEIYQTHIETMVEARRAANNARAKWKAAEARLEAMRTVEATRRAEMTAFKGRI
jgi:hypothetical protein